MREAVRLFGRGKRPGLPRVANPWPTNAASLNAIAMLRFLLSPSPLPVVFIRSRRPLVLSPVDDMRVDVGGGADRGVAEAFRHRRQRHSLCKQRARVRVPEAVQARALGQAQALA